MVFLQTSLWLVWISNIAFTVLLAMFMVMFLYQLNFVRPQIYSFKITPKRMPNSWEQCLVEVSGLSTTLSRILAMFSG